MKRAFVVAAVVLAACQKTETPEQMAARMKADADSARAGITAAMQGWTQHMTAGHVDSIGQYYAQAARGMYPDMPTIHGRDNIVAGMRPMTGLGTWHFTFRTDSVWAGGGHAFETGTWSFHLVKAAGAPGFVDTLMSGKRMAHWIQENGRWVMADDIYNTDSPETRAPASPRR